MIFYFDVGDINDFLRNRIVNNILKSREKSGLNNTNPNGNNIP